jgi:hypothetical protein
MDPLDEERSESREIKERFLINLEQTLKVSQAHLSLSLSLSLTLSHTHTPSLSSLSPVSLQTLGKESMPPVFPYSALSSLDSSANGAHPATAMNAAAAGGVVRYDPEVLPFEIHVLEAALGEVRER